MVKQKTTTFSTSTETICNNRKSDYFGLNKKKHLEYVPALSAIARNDFILVWIAMNDSI